MTEKMKTHYSGVSHRRRPTPFVLRPGDVRSRPKPRPTTGAHHKPKQPEATLVHFAVKLPPTKGPRARHSSPENVLERSRLRRYQVEETLRRRKEERTADRTSTLCCKSNNSVQTTSDEPTSPSLLSRTTSESSLMFPKSLTGFPKGSLQRSSLTAPSLNSSPTLESGDTSSSSSSSDTEEEEASSDMRDPCVDDSPGGKQRTKVSFALVQVKEFKYILGDNPSVSRGPPLTIDWEAFSTREWSVNEFEDLRQPLRRPRWDMRLTSRQREHMVKRANQHSAQLVVKSISSTSLVVSSSAALSASEPCAAPSEPSGPPGPPRPSEPSELSAPPSSSALVVVEETASSSALVLVEKTEHKKTTAIINQSVKRQRIQKVEPLLFPSSMKNHLTMGLCFRVFKNATFGRKAFRKERKLISYSKQLRSSSTQRGLVT